MELEVRETPLAPAAEHRYFSRELSMLQFHERVLDQARPRAHPLLERLKFLAISDANLDEFLSVHFPLLLGRVEMGDTTLTPDGNTQTEQLRRVRDALSQRGVPGPGVHERRAVRSCLVGTRPTKAEGIVVTRTGP